jgi:hypothetical protein
VQSFKRAVGMISNSHCLLGREFNMSDLSASERDGVLEAMIERQEHVVGFGSEGASVLEDCESRIDCNEKRMEEILSEKNEQNVSAIEGDGMELGSEEGDLR